MFFDWIWTLNVHQIFTTIIKMQAIMHITMIVLKKISVLFDNNKMTTWRISINFIASMIQLTVNIISIGWYVNAFTPKKNADATISSPSCLPFGVWHMVNIYQFWVLVEIISFFTNFVAIMLTMFVSSLTHLKIEKVFKVPAALN